MEWLELPPLAGQMRWAVALGLAWIAGEVAFRALRVPRISTYGIVGFILGHAQTGFLPGVERGGVGFLADLAFGLVLFELGYRINLRWLRTNPWIGITSVVEACATFAAVFAIASWMRTPTLAALLVAAMSMATSPAAVLRVINEQRSSGQVTQRTLHLTAFNCLLAVLFFKAILGYSIFDASGEAVRAVWSSFFVLIFSAALGALFGVAMPAALLRLGRHGRDVTVGFAIAAAVLVALTSTLRYSPVVAALVFGLVARHRRVLLDSAERNFGALGNLLTVLLFVFIAASLDWRNAWAGTTLALAVIAARSAVKIAVVTGFARLGGITWRKGLLTGLALTPISAFVLLLLEQTRQMEIAMLDQLFALSAMVLILEIVGPVVTQVALRAAGEARSQEG